MTLNGGPSTTLSWEVHMLIPIRFTGRPRSASNKEQLHCVSTATVIVTVKVMAKPIYASTMCDAQYSLRYVDPTCPISSASALRTLQLYTDLHLQSHSETTEI